MSPERTIATLILRHRWLLLALLAAGSFFFGWQFRHFSIANDPLKELSEDTPDMQTLRRFEAKFGRIDLHYGLEVSDKRERSILTMEHMIRACFMTSVTTAVGIGSLATSPVKSIHEFGVWAAVGIMIAYLLVMTLLPIILSFLPPPRDPPAGARAGTGAWADRLAKFLQKKAWLIWSVTAIVFLPSSSLFIPIIGKRAAQIGQNFSL